MKDFREAILANNGWWDLPEEDFKDIEEVEETIVDDTRRWFINKFTVLKVDGELWGVSWAATKSELGEDEFYDAYRVEPTETVVTVYKKV